MAQFRHLACLLIVAAFGIGPAAVALADPPQRARPEDADQRAELLKRFDKNGNGRLDPEEMQAARTQMAQRGSPQGDRREELLKRFDKNGNGRLDPEEIEAARAQMAQGQGPARKGRPAAGPQRRGPANGTPPAANREELLKRFDANGNGQLDPDEIQAARAAMPQRPNRRAPK